MIYPDKHTVPVEETDRTIATILKDKVAYPSLIVPEEIKADVERELGGMQ